MLIGDKGLRVADLESELSGGGDEPLQRCPLECSRIQIGLADDDGAQDRPLALDRKHHEVAEVVVELVSHLAPVRAVGLRQRTAADVMPLAGCLEDCAVRGLEV